VIGTVVVAILRGWSWVLQHVLDLCDPPHYAESEEREW
jgi:hypothetical protein